MKRITLLSLLIFLAVAASASAKPLIGLANNDTAVFRQTQQQMPLQLWGSYVAWDDTRGLAYFMNRAKAMHVRPYITWEPWAPSTPKNYTNSRIAAGKYDKYIIAQAKAARHYHRAVIIRLAHEMNGWWYPWSVNAPAYRKMWVHTVKLFRKNGATNVKFMWAPNPNAGWTDAQNIAAFRKYWPGSKYVDLAGMTFTRGLLHAGSWVDDFMHRLETVKAFTGKPTWIAEATVDTEERDRWMPDLRAGIMARPWIQGVVWYDSPKMDSQWGTEDWLLRDNPSVQQALTF